MKKAALFFSFCILIALSAYVCADPVIYSGANMQDNTLKPGALRGTVTPDNTMYPRFKSTTEFEWVSLVKTFTIPIDNIIGTDNLVVWRTPRAITIDNAWCYVTYDNVVGDLLRCATDNVDSCSIVDSWTVVRSGGTPFNDNSMTAGAVAAGEWIRWSVVSVGTESRNNFFCTVQYRE